MATSSNSSGRPKSIIDDDAQRRAARSKQNNRTVLATEEGERGRDAAWPSQIPALGWKDIGWRLWEEFNKDRVLLVAAGATFYLLLALFPALAAFVSLYGFVADPGTVADHVAYLGSLLPSAGLATVVWIAASWMFSFYLQHFANYNVTYGSLGAVVGLMMWTWISVIILISGAAINAEMEHQTALDSTTGPPLPMGERGAVVADTLGKALD